MDIQEGQEGLEPQTDGTQDQTQEGVTQQPDIFDLASVDKFKWKDKEYTRDEFERGWLRTEDYTKKTQEIGQERKYYANLQADLELVKQNPALASEFKKVYPSNFHGYLNYVSSTPGQQPKGVAVPNASENSDVSKLMERLERIESETHSQKVEAAGAEIDAVMEKLGPKYPLATNDVVLARAQAFVDRGEKLTAQAWEAIYKSVEDSTRALFEKHYKAKQKEQTEANQKAKDMPSGGSIAGRAPAKFKNIKDAETALMEHMRRQG